MNFHIVTLFPDSFDSYINSSIVGRAIKDKKIKVNFYNPRNFTKNKNHRVDQKPYGGGPGMVIEADPVIRAIEKARGRKKDVKIILTTPSGKQFTNKIAANQAKKFKHIIIVCGRYEGIDARVKKIFRPEEISIGDYVLTGGELPAMVMMDAISRQISGVLGNFDSIEESRISTSEVYTRPEILKYKSKNYKVPTVLLSGDHKKIEEWKEGRNKSGK
jgi:tRNA (guanine37-N1)-methyltransferase